MERKGQGVLLYACTVILPPDCEYNPSLPDCKYVRLGEQDGCCDRAFIGRSDEYVPDAAIYAGDTKEL